MGSRWLFMIAGILFLVLVVLLWTSHVLSPVATSSVPVEVGVAGEVGIKLDKDKMYFGTVPAGNVARRPVVVSVPEDSFVVLKPGGDIAEWLEPKRNGFELEGGTNTSVMVRAEVPAATEDGMYSGELSVVAYRPAARLFLGGE